MRIVLLLLNWFVSGSDLKLSSWVSCADWACSEAIQEGVARLNFIGVKTSDDVDWLKVQSGDTIVVTGKDAGTLKGVQLLHGYVKGKEEEKGFGLFPVSVLRVLRDKLGTLNSRRYFEDLQKEKRGLDVASEVESGSGTEPSFTTTVPPTPTPPASTQAPRVDNFKLTPLQKTSQVWSWIDSMLDDRFVDRLLLTLKDEQSALLLLVSSRMATQKSQDKPDLLRFHQLAKEVSASVESAHGIGKRRESRSPPTLSELSELAHRVTQLLLDPYAAVLYQNAKGKTPPKLSEVRLKYGIGEPEDPSGKDAAADVPVDDGDLTERESRHQQAQSDVQRENAERTLDGIGEQEDAQHVDPEVDVEPEPSSSEELGDEEEGSPNTLEVTQKEEADPSDPTEQNEQVPAQVQSPVTYKDETDPEDGQFQPGDQRSAIHSGEENAATNDNVVEVQDDLLENIPAETHPGDETGGENDPVDLGIVTSTFDDLFDDAAEIGEEVAELGEEGEEEIFLLPPPLERNVPPAEEPGDVPQSAGDEHHHQGAVEEHSEDQAGEGNGEEQGEEPSSPSATVDPTRPESTYTIIDEVEEVLHVDLVTGELDEVIDLAADIEEIAANGHVGEAIAATEAVLAQVHSDNEMDQKMIHGDPATDIDTTEQIIETTEAAADDDFNDNQVGQAAAEADAYVSVADPATHNAVEEAANPEEEQQQPVEENVRDYPGDFVSDGTMEKVEAEIDEEEAHELEPTVEEVPDVETLEQDTAGVPTPTPATQFDYDQFEDLYEDIEPDTELMKESDTYIVEPVEPTVAAEEAVADNDSLTVQESNENASEAPTEDPSARMEREFREREYLSMLEAKPLLFRIAIWMDHTGQSSFGQNWLIWFLLSVFTFSAIRNLTVALGDGGVAAQIATLDKALATQKVNNPEDQQRKEQAQLHQAHSELTTTKQEIQAIEEKIKALKSFEADFDKYLAQINENAIAMKQETDNLTAKGAHLDSEMETERQRFTELEQESHRDSQTIEDIGNVEADIRRKIQELIIQHENTAEGKGKLEAEIKKSKLVNQNFIQELKDLGGGKLEHDKVMTKLMKEMSKADNQLQSVQQQIFEQKVVYTWLEGNAYCNGESAEEIMSNQRSFLVDAIKQVPQCNAEHKKLLEENDSLIAQIESIKVSFTEIDRQIAAADRNDELQQQSLHLKEEVETLQAKLEVTNDYYAKRETEISAQLGSETAERGNFESTYESQKQREGQLKDQLDKLKEQCGDLETKWDDADIKYNKMISELEERKTTNYMALMDAETKVVQLTQVVRSLRNDTNEIDDRIEQAQEYMGELDVKLDDTSRSDRRSDTGSDHGSISRSIGSRISATRPGSHRSNNSSRHIPSGHR